MRAALALLILLTASFAGCSSDPEKDSDGDGLFDHEETTGWIVRVDLIDRRIEYRVTSDPNKADTDGDGLGDAFEAQHLPSLDPTKADTDGDGLTDCQEALHSMREECESNTWTGQTDGGTGTDAADADSDAGFGRYLQNVIGFTDETGTLTQPAQGDGIPDGEELAGYNITLANGVTRFVQTDPRSTDTDSDGLEDGEERFVFFTDPLVENTDGDACTDGRDPLPAYAERYDLNWGTLDIDANFPHASVDIQWQVNTVEHAFWFPDTTQTVHRGSNDLSQRDPEPRTWKQCTSSAHQPWTRIQLEAYYQDSDTVRLLDLTSISVPTGTEGFTPFVWMHIPTGEFAWEMDGERFAGPLLWQGEHGSLSWWPRVV